MSAHNTRIPAINPPIEDTPAVEGELVRFAPHYSETPRTLAPPVVVVIQQAPQPPSGPSALEWIGGAVCVTAGIVGTGMLIDRTTAPKKARGKKPR